MMKPGVTLLNVSRGGLIDSGEAGLGGARLGRRGKVERSRGRTEAKRCWIGFCSPTY